jgi:hypothetical protein
MFIVTIIKQLKILWVLMLDPRFLKLVELIDEKDDYFQLMQKISVCYIYILQYLVVIKFIIPLINLAIFYTIII